MPPRKKFHRPLGRRRYRKLFVVATEGNKTEPQYFAMFNNQNSIIRVNCIKGRHDSSPTQVLNRMTKYLKKESLKASDEAWLVVDRDNWNEEQLTQLHEWSQKAKNYKFALSNPKFEYWLLLHFEDGTGIASSRDCSDRLKRYLPEYDKGIDIRKVTLSMIQAAVSRAKQRDTPPCLDWPRDLGSTTVYRLVENILKVE
jgi:hypothetical protein